MGNIEELKMNLFDFKMNWLCFYLVNLKEGALQKLIPTDSGVYALYIEEGNDMFLKKVGKAAGGLLYRMNSYYNCNDKKNWFRDCITIENRDNVYVQWAVCNKWQTRDIELYMFDRIKDEGIKLDWVKRR